MPYIELINRASNVMCGSSSGVLKAEAKTFSELSIAAMELLGSSAVVLTIWSCLVVAQCMIETGAETALDLLFEYSGDRRSLLYTMGPCLSCARQKRSRTTG